MVIWQNVMHWVSFNFVESLSKKETALHEISSLIKTGIATKFPRDFQDFKANTSLIPVTSEMQQMEIWMVILLLSRKKFHVKIQ